MDKVLLIGNLTIDHNCDNGKIFDGPGGSVYFAGKTFHNLGLDPLIISPYGKDFLEKYPLPCKVIRSSPICDKTLAFKNIYHEGIREQEAENSDCADLNDILKNASITSDDYNILLVAPVLPNINYDQIVQIINHGKNSLKVLVPQGFYRQVGSDGKIIPKGWAQESSITEMFDIIVVSDKDGEDIENSASSWSKKGVISIVTKESRGCSVYQHGNRLDFPAYEVKNIIDATGAGDVFTAAFSYLYKKTSDIPKSADFANAAAALSLRYHSNQLQYDYQDISGFIKNYKRRKEL